MQTKSLKEICSLITKGTTPTSLGFKLNEGNVNFIKVECLSGDGSIIKDKIQKIDVTTHEKLNRSKLQEGDILYSIAGSIGRLAIVDTSILPANTNQAVAILRPRKELINTRYLFYFLKDTKSQISAKRKIVQSVQTNLSLGELSSLEVAIPNPEIQNAIGNFMANLDAKIAANDLLSKTLENIAQSIFKSWFIDFDPVHANMAGEKPAGMDDATAALFPYSMVESELGTIPDGWKVGQLNSILKLNKSIVKAGPLTESVPYVPVDQISAKNIFLKNSLSGSEAKTSLVSFKKDDILFGAMRPYFHKVALAPFDGTTRTTTFVLRAINPEYLAYSLFAVYQEEAVAYATRNSQGTTIPYAIWKNSFENYPIALPPERIAKAFNDLIIPIITFGYSLIAQNQTLVAIRDEFLPRLISGQLQIPVEMLAT